MKRPIAALVLGAAMVFASASAESAAAAVTPPAGTPNLALMVVQPSDLVAGATLGNQEYVQPPTGFTAQYGSEFTSAATPDGVNYSLLLDFVALAPSASTASALFTSQQAYDESSKGRAQTVKDIIKGAGKHSRLKAKDIKFSQAQSAGVGTSSFEETITIKVKHTSVQEVYLMFVDGTVDTSLELVGVANKPVPESDAVTLAGAMLSHINTVLATGSTGASGVTG